ncbi:MAG: AAA family ATPase [Lachnospiraceae bacterium]|nr:AAA family ATPase [Lachnospiraceae bacterium]
MDKRILAILEPEEEYATMLFSFLKEKKEFLFEPRIFTKWEAVLEFQKENSIEVLLASDKSQYKELEKRVPLTMLLTEGNYVQENSMPVIYKFQSAEHILREVCSYYVNMGNDKPIRYLPREQRYYKKYVFFSPFGGVGKTTASTVMAHMLGEKKKVLLVNMEMFPKSYPWIEDTVESKGVSELLYYLHQDNYDLEMKIKSMVQKVGNADFLCGVSNLWDLQNMKIEEMQSFLQALEECTSYEIIIFDVTFLTEAVSILLEQADKIFQPCIHVSQDDISWMQVFPQNVKENLENKLEVLQLPRIETKEAINSVEYLARGAYGQKIYERLKKAENYVLQ